MVKLIMIRSIILEKARLRKNKKVIIFLYICFFCLLIIFCKEKETNTWTIRDNFTVLGEADIEYTVITKEQYDRLLKQHTINNEYGSVLFTDELEANTNNSGRVIKGSPPKLNGYYYILMKTTARNEELAEKLIYSGFGNSLQYGNSDIGWLTIVLWNNKVNDNTYLLSSEDFKREYNKCLKLVNGE